MGFWSITKKYLGVKLETNDSYLRGIPCTVYIHVNFLACLHQHMTGATSNLVSLSWGNIAITKSDTLLFAMYIQYVLHSKIINISHYTLL